MYNLLKSVVAFLLLCPQWAKTQCINWQPATIVPAVTADLRAVHFPDPQNGWAVGGNATVLKSTNQGSSWTSRTLPGVSVMLNSVHFANTTTGWVVGNRGFIQKTTDGGTTWLPQTSGTSVDLYDVWFVDEQKGWIAGSCGLILYTTNGGTNWNQQSTGQSGHLFQIKVPNGSTGIATSSTASLLHTANGGTPWTVYTGTARGFRAFDMELGGTAFAASGDGRMIRSTNAGVSWTATGALPAGTNSWQTLSMTTANTAYVGGLEGKLSRTVNGGTSWTDFKAGLSTTDIYGLQMSGDTLGWAVGEGGKIFRYRSSAAALSVSGPTAYCNTPVTLMASGAPYTTWRWSTSGNPVTQSISVNAAGTYTVTATIAGSCTSTATVTLSASTPPAPQITGPTALCPANAVLQAGSFSNYLWSNNATTASLTATQAGTYTVTVTNAQGCTGTDSHSISGTSTPPTPQIAGPTALCPANAVLQAGSFSNYLWSNNATTADITATQAGTYTVTVTNAQGCTGTDSHTITGTSTPPTPQIAGPTALCPANAVLQAGSFSSYLWSNSATTASLTATQAGTYTVTVTNAQGCTGTDSHSISGTSTPPTPQIAGPTALCPANAVLQAGSFSSYLWSNSATTASLTATQAGTYTVTVTNAQGCTGTDSHSISGTSTPPTPQIAGPTALCPANAVLQAGSFSSYLWSNNATTADITATQTGTYTVTVTNAQGCTGTDSHSISGTSTPPDMVAVVGGSFMMGCTPEQQGQCTAEENPVHAVTLRDFEIGKYEVTQGEWTNLMGSNPSFYSSCGTDCPVERVSWYDVAVYCNRLSDCFGQVPCYYSDSTFLQVYGKNGNTWSLPNNGPVYWKKDANGYRLPTEAEWEYAARGGAQPQGYIYAGGNGPNDVSWNEDNEGNTPRRVGRRTPTNLGVYDMSGNVWELCSDRYEAYTNLARCNPVGSLAGNKIIVRGGSFDNAKDLLRVSYRTGNFVEPNKPVNTVGFRLAKGSILPPTCSNALIQPAQSATNIPVNTILRWAASKPCAEGYRISLGTTPGGSDLLNNQIVTDTFYQPVQPLPAGDTLYIRITPFNGAGSANGCTDFWCVTASSCITVTTTADSGPGSLREAIDCANANPRPDTIRFNIAGAGPHVVQLASRLPGLNNAGTVVAGHTQPGWHRGMIVLEGSNLSAGTAGIAVTGDSCMVDGLYLRNCPVGIAVIQADGVQIGSTQYGNTIGGPMSGVGMETSGSAAFRAVGNRIGTDPETTRTDGPQMCCGIRLLDVRNSRIENNTVGGISKEALVIEGDSVLVRANYFGTNASGTAALPNLTSVLLTKPQTRRIQLQGNTIAYSTFTGVAMDSVGQADLYNNAFYCNSPYAVRIFNGSNGRIAPPEIVAAIPGEITGISPNSGAGRLEVFRVSGCGAGATCRQGRVLVGWKSVANLGNWSFQSPDIHAGDTLTVLITKDGNAFQGMSSEFSECKAVCVASSLQITGSPTFCPGGSTNLSAPAGFAQYNWSSGQTTATISANAAQIYIVTVRDAAGCSGTASATVTQSAGLSPQITGSPTFCPGGSTNLSAPAGFAQYNWSSGQTTATISVNAAQIYIVTVRDAAGCSGTASVTVTQSNALSPQITGSPTFCPGGSTNLSAPAGFAQYNWSSGQTTATILANAAQTYTVTVRDAAGCSGTASVTVTQSNALSPQITGSTTFCSGGSTNLSAPAGFAQYNWSSGQTTATISVNAAQIYIVTVRDAAGCSGTASATVTQSNALSPQITGSTTFCPGGSTNLSAPAGFAQYNWSSGQTTATISVNAAQIYIVTVRDAAGCSGTASATVTQSNALSPQITGSTTFCSGGSTNLSAPAGFAQYNWSSGQTTATISVNAAQTYTVTVRDAAGCSGTASVTVTQSNALSPQITGSTTFCSGGSTNLSAPAGFAQYNWSSGQTTATISVNAAQIYIVTVRDAAGCSGTASATVTQSNALSPQITGSTTFCPGGSTNLSAPAGFAQYNWSSGQTTATISVNAAQIYIVTVRDAAGCSGTASATVTQSNALSPQITGSTTFCSGGSTNLSAPAGFAQYNWSSGQTTATISVNAAQTYTVTVRDAAGCSGTASATVTQSNALSPQITGSNTFCPGGSTSISAPAGFAQYNWSSGQTTATISANAVQTYTVTVRDAAGCSGTASATVTQSNALSPQITGSNTFCPGGSTNLSAPAGFAQYNWSSGQTTATISANAAQIYIVTVRDAAGCSGTASVTVTQSNALSPQITGSPTFCPGGSTNLSAPAGFAQYNWSSGQTTATISVNAAQIYIVTVRDAAGCSGTASVTVTQSNALSPQITGSTTFCPGGSTNLSATAGFAQYNWSSGQTTAAISVNAAQTYTVTVRDAAGCSGTASATVTQSAGLSPQITGSNTFCPGGSTNLSAPAGFAQYNWSSGQTTATISANAAQIYIVTVRDAAGCSGTASATVTQSAGLSPQITGSTTFCPGGSTNLSAPAGFAQYNWSSGQTTATILANAAQTYTVTVRDAAGCSGTASVTVTQSNALSPQITGSTTFCSGGSTNLSAPAGFAQYNWSSGQTTATISVNAAQIYIVTVRDAAGCSGTASATVTQSNALSPQITGSNTFCPGGSTSISAPSGFAQYNWSSGQTTATISVNAAQIYIVTVRDAAGCSGTASATVTQSNALSPQITGSTTFCPGGSTNLSATAGFAQYNWSSGQTTAAISVNAAQTYTVTVRDAAGCSGTASATVTQSNALSPQITGSNTFCPGGSTNLSATAGFAQYNWSSGQTTATISVNAAQIYIVTVRDAAGCSGTASATVTQSNALSPQITGSNTFCPGGSTSISAPSGFAQYNWSSGQTTATISVNAAQIYIVTVRDAAGCSGTASATVTQSSGLSPQITGSNTFCPGGSTNLSAPAGFAQYNWSSGQTTATISANAAQIYIVTVRDAAGCSGTASATVTQSSGLSPQITGSNTFCPGGSTSISAPSGFAQYNWSSGQTTATISANAAQIYIVTVRDAAGCSGTASVTVTQSSGLSPQITGSNTFCPGGSTNLSAPAGFAQYNWSSGQTTATISANAAQIYIVTVRDAAGCSGTASVTVKEGNALNADIVTTASTSCTGGNGTAVASASGGTLPYRFLWNTGATAASLTNLTPGTYTVTIQDMANCNTIVTANIGNQGNNPTRTLRRLICHGDSIRIAGVVYKSSGQYPYIQKGQNGACDTVVTLQLTVQRVTAQLSADPPALCGKGTTTLQLSVTNCPGCDYEWDNPAWSGGQKRQVQLSATSRYAVTVASENGCSGTAAVAVRVWSGDTLWIDSVLCPGEKIPFCSLNRRESGTFVCKGYSRDGCDSITVLRLTLLDPKKMQAHPDTLAVENTEEPLGAAVLQNDLLPQSVPWTVRIVRPPTQGSAVISSDTIVLYTPPGGDFLGLDSLTYAVEYGRCIGISVEAKVFFFIIGDLERFERLIPNVVHPEADALNNNFDPLEVLRTNGLPFSPAQAELSLVERTGNIVWRSGNPYRPVSREEVGQLPPGQYYYLLKIGRQVMKGAVWRM